MTRKYINFFMNAGAPLIVRDASLEEADGFYIAVSGNMEWRVNMDSVQYVKITNEAYE